MRIARAARGDTKGERDFTRGVFRVCVRVSGPRRDMKESMPTHILACPSACVVLIVCTYFDCEYVK